MRAIAQVRAGRLGYHQMTGRSDELTLSGYVDVFRRNLTLILSIIVFFTLMAVAFNVFAPFRSEAVASVLIRTEQNSRSFPSVILGSDEALLRNPDTEVEFVFSERFQAMAREVLPRESELEARLADDPDRDLNAVGVIEIVGLADEGVNARIAANRGAELYVDQRRSDFLDDAASARAAAEGRIEVLQTAKSDLLRPLEPIDAALLRATRGDDIATLSAQRLTVQQQLADDLRPIQTELDDLQRAASELAFLESSLASEGISACINRPAETAGSLGPPLPLLLGSFAILGLALGLIAALVRESIQDRLESADDVSRVTTVPIVAEIPETEADDLFAVPDAQGTPYVEAFDRLVTFIGLVHPSRTGNRFLVTSATAAEGKTTVVAHLGHRMARSGIQTVAIEADLRRPKLSYSLGADPRQPGLSEVLRNETDVTATVIQPDPDLPLYLLPAGSRTDSAASMIRSSEMATITRKLSQDNEIVLLDTPPILPVSDAQALTAIASDHVLFVVRAGRTTASELREALTRLSAANATPAGIVIVGAERRRGYEYD